MLVLKRRDPARNMARFYVLTIEDTLFGRKALLRRWGRIGTGGREIRQLYPDEASAAAAMVRWATRKQKRGYEIDSPGLHEKVHSADHSSVVS